MRVGTRVSCPAWHTCALIRQSQSHATHRAVVSGAAIDTVTARAVLAGAVGAIEVGARAVPAGGRGRSGAVEAWTAVGAMATWAVPAGEARAVGAVASVVPAGGRGRAGAVEAWTAVGAVAARAIVRATSGAVVRALRRQVRGTCRRGKGARCRFCPAGASTPDDDLHRPGPQQGSAPLREGHRLQPARPVRSEPRGQAAAAVGSPSASCRSSCVAKSSGRVVRCGSRGWAPGAVFFGAQCSSAVQCGAICSLLLRRVNDNGKCAGRCAPIPAPAAQRCGCTSALDQRTQCSASIAHRHDRRRARSSAFQCIESSCFRSPVLLFLAVVAHAWSGWRRSQAHRRTRKTGAEAARTPKRSSCTQCLRIAGQAPSGSSGSRLDGSLTTDTMTRTGEALGAGRWPDGFLTRGRGWCEGAAGAAWAGGVGEEDGEGGKAAWAGAAGAWRGVAGAEGGESRAAANAGVTDVAR